MGEADQKYDVAVIGGGVVGCAVARRFVLEGARVLLLEKAADILAGASKGNSAILHTGFDAPEGSLELACMQEGYREYVEIFNRLGLALQQSGAVVAAWDEDQLSALDAIAAKAHRNGVDDVRRLDRAEFLRREPHLAPRVRGGLLVPREHLIDPWSAPLAYLLQAVQNGGTVWRGAEMRHGDFSGASWRLETSRRVVEAGWVINCAGLYGDEVDARLTGETEFAVRPRKGQFVVFDKISARLLRTIILPVPSERTKGIVLTPTVFGNLLVGPTAEEQDFRDRAPTDEATLRLLVGKATEMLPALAGIPITATYAGLRPATEHKHYCVRADRTRNLITLGGIRSTGLTAALGLARHAYRLYADETSPHEALRDPAWPQAPRLAESLVRDWQRPGSDIVCHCEAVTKREIEAALSGPLPAVEFGGLKRRTRAGMGRCQGFYCNARLAGLLREAAHG